MLLLFVLVNGTQAQEEHLKLHFDFSKMDGTSVTDVVGGINASIIGSATIEKVGKYNVLNLGNASGYLDMTNAVGNIIKNLGDFTVSACYRVDEAAPLSGNGFFLWAFSTSAACTQSEGRYMAYRLNAQRFAISTGGYGSETGMEMGSASPKGRWIHVLYRQSGQQGELFIDGNRVRQNSGMPVLSETFAVSPAYCWIGRAPFSGDSYLRQTLVADFRVYDISVSDEQLADLAAVAADIENELNYGTPGDFTGLQAKC